MSQPKSQSGNLLTRAAWLAAAILLVCSAARAQISPGPLSRAHTGLEGVAKCTSCHRVAGSATGFKCSDCHTEIKRRVEAGMGFHARAFKESGNQTECARCHAEHRGLNVNLIPLDRKSFDHLARTGFMLEGKHRVQKCESCHTEAKIAAAARREIKVKDLNRTFLGLSRECNTCHRDPHQSQLGTTCLSCHTMDIWKPASKFNHARAAFPLTGRHQQLACEKCHNTNAPTGGADAARNDANQRVLLFKGLSFTGCQSCHSDPHHGAFLDVKLGNKCEACHDTGGWKNNRPGVGFNHNLTKFPLVGKHAALACARCHRESNFQRPVAHEFCRDCHQDPHKGQFAARAAGSDCSACHSPENFKPALFDREAHMRSSFPLMGKHANLACSKCHEPQGRDTVYKSGKLQCSDCHPDAHGGDFAQEPYRNRCDQCHTQSGFETTTFTRERHAQTKFPLTEAHAELECGKCHKPIAQSESQTAREKGRAIPRLQFHLASDTCTNCHKDPHAFDGQRKYLCETCHEPAKWQTLRVFDHSRTAFKLDGKHQDIGNPIACIRCHKPSGQGGGARAIPVFSGAASQCAGCHSEKDKHGGQFNSPGNPASDCSACHVTAGWNTKDFNHNNTRFPLNVAHRNVSCGKCHVDQKEVSGIYIRIYRGTPADCLQCHN